MFGVGQKTFFLYSLAIGLVLLTFLVQPDDGLTKMGRSSYSVEVADTLESRRQGLSGREGLADSDALLFKFDSAGRHGIWMKDMKFAIDVVWLDQEGHVIYIKDNLSPSTYPETYRPDTDALYVVEFNDGQLEANGLKLGDTVKL